MTYNLAQMRWPTQAQVPAVFGEAGSMAATTGLVNLAYPMRVAWALGQTVRQFRCHSRCENAIESIFQKTLKHYGYEKIVQLGLDLYGGCYNFRPMRGSKRMSMHAYGIAVDIDPSHNQLKWNKSKARFAKPEYIPFWNIVESEGAVSLGRERDYDWMHFQFARI